MSAGSLRFIWSFSIVLSLAALAFGAPRETVQFTSIDSNGIQNSPANVVRTAQLVGGYDLGRIDLTGTLTQVHPNTWRTDARVLITSPSGEMVLLQPFAAGSSFTTLSVNLSTFMPASVAPAGLWTFRFFEVIDDGGVLNVDARWDLTISFTDEEAVPPPAVDLGVVSGSGLAVPPLAIAPGLVQWLKFQVPCGVSRSRNWYLDVDTAGSTINGSAASGTFPNDTQLGLYNSQGLLIASDDDSGDGFLAQLSFGAGSGLEPAVGADGDAFSGSDGRLLPGTYYLAVGTYRMILGSDRWAVTPMGTQAGTIVVSLRSGLPIQGQTCPCDADFNGVGGVSIQDLLDFLAYWFAAEPDADFNRQGGVTLQDLFDFLASWFAGCP